MWVVLHQKVRMGLFTGPRKQQINEPEIGKEAESEKVLHGLRLSCP